MGESREIEKAPMPNRGFRSFGISLLALGALAMYRSGLEAAFFEYTLSMNVRLL